MRTFLTAISATLLLLVLVGCVRFQADLTISADDTVTGEVVVAVLVNDAAEDGERVATERAAELEAALLPALSGAVGVTRSEYTDNDYRGSRLTLDNTPLSAFADPGTGEALTIVRSGDRIVLTAAVDLTNAGVGGVQDEATPSPDEAGAAEAGADISVRVTFPGEVLSHNGVQNGRTVVWTTELDRPITLEAEAQVDEGRDLSLFWVGMIITAIVAIAIVILVVSRRRRAGTEESQHGTA